jgi:cytoskeleton protein RodZ
LAYKLAPAAPPVWEKQSVIRPVFCVLLDICRYFSCIISAMSIVVGKKLREAREAKKLTLAEAASSTHIRLHYLEAMESGKFDVLPSRLQVKGFLRAYAGYLGLNPQPLIEAVDLDPWSALESLSKEAKSEPDEPDTPEIDSASRFESIGESLKSQREILGLSLEDVEQHTHLRIRYLTALEAGKMDALPSPVQGRGMLKNYADFLGMDSDQLLLRFADGLQARLSESTIKTSERFVRPKTRPSRRERRFLSRDLIFGVILALFLVTFIVWGTLQVTELRSDQEEEPTAPSIAEVLLPSATPTLFPTATPTLQTQTDENNAAVEVVAEPIEEETQETLFISDNVDGVVQVQIVSRQRTWMRITVDGKVEFDGRTMTGSAYGFAGEEYVEITTGNGAALQVFYNDLDLGILGDYGEIINFVITASGVQTPTPTITLTPTNTVTPTGTQTPEITQTPAP